MTTMCGPGGVAYSSQRHDWETPQDFFDALDAEFSFDLDAAASASNAKCSDYYDEADDGLSQDWGGGLSGSTRHTAARSAGGWPRRPRRPASRGRRSSCSCPRGRTRGGSTTACTAGRSYGSFGGGSSSEARRTARRSRQWSRC